jgi:dTDP-4-amino-4,6-dideoxygalactose transaminase
MDNTVSLSERLLRLPLWVGMSDEQQERVVDVLRDELCR